jgi:hypothetical protein
VVNHCQSIFGIGSSLNLIAGLFEMKRQAAAHERIIIHEQDHAGHRNSLHLIEWGVYICRQFF